MMGGLPIHDHHVVQNAPDHLGIDREHTIEMLKELRLGRSRN